MNDQTAQAKSNRPTSAGAKVTVACKMETGLRLRTFNMIRHQEPVLGGGFREGKIAHFDREVWVNGVGKRMEQAPRCEVVGGYALTPGIDKDHWERWAKDNAESPIVQNELIFAHENADYVRDWCRERVAQTSGTQQLSGGDDPRAPKSNVVITDEDGRAKSNPRRAA